MKDTIPVNRFVCTSVVALYLYMLSFYLCSPLYTSIKQSDNNNNLYYVFSYSYYIQHIVYVFVAYCSTYCSTYCLKFSFSVCLTFLLFYVAQHLVFHISFDKWNIHKCIYILNCNHIIIIHLLDITQQKYLDLHSILEYRFVNETKKNQCIQHIVNY